MLVASARRRGMPAGRARARTLQPSHVEKKCPEACKKAKGRTTYRSPRRHHRSNHSGRREYQRAERHQPNCSSATEERPGPEPGTTDGMEVPHLRRLTMPFSPRILLMRFGEHRRALTQTIVLLPHQENENLGLQPSVGRPPIYRQVLAGWVVTERDLSLIINAWRRLRMGGSRRWLRVARGRPRHSHRCCRSPRRLLCS